MPSCIFSILREHEPQLHGPEAKFDIPVFERSEAAAVRVSANRTCFIRIFSSSTKAISRGCFYTEAVCVCIVAFRVDLTTFSLRHA